MNITNNQSTTIQDVKSLIANNIGKNISVTESNKQGKVINAFTGELVGTYDYFFVLKMKIKECYIKKSFSYVYFLTNELSIEIL